MKRSMLGDIAFGMMLTVAAVALLHLMAWALERENPPPLWPVGEEIER